MKSFRFLPLLSLVLIFGSAGDSWAASVSEPTAPPSNPIVSSSSIPLAEARIIIEGAVAYARNLKMRMSVAVLDDGGHLVSVDRMDGTSFNSERQATGKAFAAVMTRQPTAAIADLLTTAPNRFYGIMNMYPARFILFPAGCPWQSTIGSLAPWVCRACRPALMKRQRRRGSPLGRSIAKAKANRLNPCATVMR